MRRSGLPATYRIWLLRGSSVVCLFATIASLRAGELLSAVSSAMLGIYAGLLSLGFQASPQPMARLLFWVVVVLLIGLTLYRLLFTFATPT